MTTQIGLYFPYFYFPSDEWVKLSALYWDKIYRLVPHGYQTTRDTEDVIELSRGDARVLDIVHPEDNYQELEKIKNEFIQLIEDHTDELVRHYGIENYEHWNVNPEAARAYSDGGEKFGYLHSYKLEHELAGLMIKRGLATREVSVVGRNNHWVAMHPHLANVYMAALAETISRHDPFSANPLANDPMNYFAVGGFTFERLAQVLLEDAKISSQRKISRTEIESRLALIAVKGVMPKNIKKVPVDKILALREANAGKLGKFQELVASVVAELPNLGNADAGPFVNDYLETEYKKKIKPQLDELEDSIFSLELETVPAIVNIQIKLPPVLAGVATGGLAVIDPHLGASAAIGFALLKVFNEKRKAVEKSVKNSDVAYLLHVKEDLAPINTLEWVSGYARKVLFGI
jgi:hypothetical protein